MELPSFLKHFLDEEFRKMHETLLEQVADKYGLDAEILKDEFLNELTILPKEGTKITITRKYKPRKVPPDECRCTARIWNHGYGGRCMKKCMEGESLCMQHVAILEKKKKLPYGYYDETPPKNVFSGKHRSVYV
jgi:hypothetical protein